MIDMHTEKNTGSMSDRTDWRRSDIAKQKTEQRYVLKIHSKRLRDAKWNLSLDLQSARLNSEVVALSDNQMLRWIDELNNNTDSDLLARRIRRQLKLLKQQENSAALSKEIQRLYNELDDVMFKPDYMCLVVDTIGDYRRAVKGFKINGIKYTRLLGTAGGVKTSTIVFVSERLAPMLRERIENGRDKTKELVPAKFEAYRALTCSGSIPVSMPNGVIVVDDCNTVFHETVARLSSDSDGEPVLSVEQDAEVELCASDGFGLMLPSLAERWSRELGLHYVAGGMNTRFAWEKGMVFAFDFLEFADTVAHTRIVKDVWGCERDLSGVELILTASQVKLWDSYDSLESYLSECDKNHYTFAVTKTAPDVLTNERDLNYQFIQSYDLSDDQIAELVAPTIQDIKNILGYDWRKTALYLGASGAKSVGDLSKIKAEAAALLINPDMVNDAHIQSALKEMTRKRIIDTKIGVISVHGNYSILSGDPYALCQSIFGMEVTGLLKSGEMFSRYWCDAGVDRVVCFRAPMSNHNNVRTLSVCMSDEASHWFQYITTCTILNAWDTTCHALNGADFDGDLIFTTDNRVLLDNWRPTLPLLCMQRKAPKAIPTEANLIESNIKGFGDDIGAITNRVTAMYDVQSQYDKDSREYKELEYRIQCGQLFQQDAIDKIKGIISKPMPAYWYSKKACVEEFSDNQGMLEFQLRICADKKPYFMQYVYPALRKTYLKALLASKRSAMYQLGVNYKDILTKSACDLNEQERIYVTTFEKDIPLSDKDCVMNRLCHMVEDAFVDWRFDSKPADAHRLMKCGVKYSSYTYYKVIPEIKYFKELSKNKALQTTTYMIDAYGNNRNGSKCVYIDEIKRMLSVACPHVSTLVDILLDSSYNTDDMRSFIWMNYKDQILSNIVRNTDGCPYMFVACSDGDIEFRGMKYSLRYMNKDGVCNEYSAE